MITANRLLKILKPKKKKKSFFMFSIEIAPSTM